jgi:hypothetical protein
MRHVRFAGWLIAGLALAAAPGCTHNYYYYNDPVGVCAPAPPAVVGSRTAAKGTVVARSTPVIIDEGSYCTVPATGQPVKVVSKPAKSKTVVDNETPPSRVVINDPNYPGYTRSRGWRNRKDYGSRDTGAAGTTQISGAISDDDLTR